MKRKPSKQLPLFSKRNSKRNKAAFLLFFLLTPFAGNSEAQNIPFENPIVVDFDFPLNDRDWLIDSLKEGHRSRLILQIRLYRENESALPFPDKSICKKNYTVTVNIDPFSGLYQITDSDGGKTFLENEDDFLREFLHCETEFSPDCDFSSDKSAYYIQKKAILIKKVYTIPFHIFQFVDYRNRLTTDWIREEL